MRGDMMLKRESGLFGFHAGLVSRSFKTGIFLSACGPHPSVKFLDPLGEILRGQIVLFSQPEFFDAAVIHCALSREPL